MKDLVVLMQRGSLSMKYSDIIENNTKKTPVSWWPKFAYHYTDVTNAANILNKKCLYSRINAEKMGLMLNDNASRQVIDMTRTSVLSNVRFYFRPLTPTQYYNEGYKHPEIRYRLLSMRGIKFSEMKQAGNGSAFYDDVEAFSKFDFRKIYSNDFEDLEKNKSFRHAEILYPDVFKIDSCLKFVLCRNAVERNTLLNLLKEKNYDSYIAYRDKIKICRKDMFYNNGLSIADCRYLDNYLYIQFSDTYEKKKYMKNQMNKRGIETLSLLKLKITLEWFIDNNACKYNEALTNVDYDDIRNIKVKVPIVDGATSICVRIYLENDLICNMEQSIAKSELIK